MARPLSYLPGGCAPPGDLVDDTAPEAVAHYGCAGRDSCPLGDVDPITNFMDYSDDICLSKCFFTGQGNRMHELTAQFRRRPGVADARDAKQGNGSRSLPT